MYKLRRFTYGIAILLCVSVLLILKEGVQFIYEKKSLSMRLTHMNDHIRSISMYNYSYENSSFPAANLYATLPDYESETGMLRKRHISKSVLDKSIRSNQNVFRQLLAEFYQSQQKIEHSDSTMHEEFLNLEVERGRLSELYKVYS